jgi:alpha-ketoglutarate-dependent taurine dioxygenase
MISIEPITPHLGAEVRGVLEPGASPKQVAITLRQALLKHHLLVLRARILNPPEQIALARIFGEPVLFDDPKIPEYPAIFRISNQQGEGHLNVGQHWHVDGTRTKSGTPISIWHVIQHPAEGGDTWYANMHRAYEDLPDDLRGRVDDLVMVSESGARHALVKRHPATKRKMLYINIRLTDHVLGMSAAQSKVLLERLDEHLNDYLDRESVHYRHKWLVGDVVIGDNFSVAHKAIPTDPRFPRTLHRVTIRGGTAFWLQAAKETNVAAQAVVDQDV